MKKTRKHYFFCGLMTLLLYMFLTCNVLTTLTDKLKNEEDKNSNNKGLKLKYILQWTIPKKEASLDMGVGQESFIKKKCRFSNCFVTTNKSYLEDYTKFDVITFEGPEILTMSFDSMPSRRSFYQKFVFISKESSDNYPICSNKFNKFFNWTWTYRLDSDATWTYIVVRNSQNQIIGPKKNMNWMKLKDMKPISDDIRDKLRLKIRAAAWFVSNCKARSSREKFVNKLRAELKKFDLELDIYGDCGLNVCPRADQEECNIILQSSYYFYLSFENSFAEDYVTEKLLYPLQNFAVPIVFGSANYTRFMMDGIYINALELGPRRLAKKMHKLINDTDQYENYFKWVNYYSYHNKSESTETDDVCTICSMLNDEEMVKKTTVYDNFRKWWDPPKRCEFIISLVNETAK